ncbi:right-handed parallel beta-helix repeat-containing protein (plasmid) [Azospirillum thermophilum]|uniref:Right-handed parallel beta-helix repeat-containing protein n=2 Tax=Azospirillum thermophilum TaxID=2202148 RepID=A0A2S2D0K4_9PROT|nr:right-handed parallel beta-helix repeat-containing protein [Azospirillum thermophilum]
MHGTGVRPVRLPPARSVLLLLAALCLTAGPAAAQERALYVAADGNDGWSGRLSRPSPDGRDGPFATLGRAVEASRAGGVKAIYLRRGTYRLDRTLVLGPQDDGLLLAAAQGESAVLSGGEPVGPLSPAGKGLVSAPMARDPGLDLFADGRRLRPATAENRNAGDPELADWFHGGPAAAGPHKRRFRFDGADLRPSDRSPGVRIQVLDRERMADDIRRIAALDPASREVELDRDAWYPLRDGTTYRVLGRPEDLRRPGQFAWDPGSGPNGGRLLLRPAGRTPGSVVVARLGTLLRLEGARSVSVRGLDFRDVPYDGKAVVVKGGGGHRFQANRFAGVGTAISLDGSSGNRLERNLMEDLGRTGIEMTGGSNDNRIVANTIRNVGEVTFFGGGIMASAASRTLIANNEIAGAARYGISIKNWNRDTISTDNVIEYNRITDTARVTADAGAIETLGRSDVDTRTVIRFNDIRRTGGLAVDASGRWLKRYKGFGIYLDDLTNGVRVEGNFLMDTGMAGVFIHGGDDNVVENNVAVLTRPNDRFVRLEWVPQAKEAGRLQNNRILRNVIEARVPVERYWDNISGGSPVVDYNVLSNAPRYRPPSDPPPGGDRPEANSLAADPQFVDPRAGNFALRAGSPAAAVGFRPIPWKRIGPEGWRPQDD